MGPRRFAVLVLAQLTVFKLHEAEGLHDEMDDETDFALAFADEEAAADNATAETEAGAVEGFERLVRLNDSSSRLVNSLRSRKAVEGIAADTNFTSTQSDEHQAAASNTSVKEPAKVAATPWWHKRRKTKEPSKVSSKVVASSLRQQRRKTEEASKVLLEKSKLPSKVGERPSEEPAKVAVMAGAESAMVGEAHAREPKDCEDASAKECVGTAAGDPKAASVATVGAVGASLELRAEEPPMQSAALSEAPAMEPAALSEAAVGATSSVPRRLFAKLSFVIVPALALLILLLAIQLLRLAGLTSCRNARGSRARLPLATDPGTMPPVDFAGTEPSSERFDGVDSENLSVHSASIWVPVDGDTNSIALATFADSKSGQPQGPATPRSSTSPGDSSMGITENVNSAFAEGECEAIDAILVRMEKAVEKLEDLGSPDVFSVKRPKIELDLLAGVGDARDHMVTLTVSTNSNRQILADVFGGDCIRIERIHEVLDAEVLSPGSAIDQRLKGCREACSTIENVLSYSFGLAKQLQEAHDIVHKKHEHRKSQMHLMSQEDLAEALKEASPDSD